MTLYREDLDLHKCGNPNCKAPVHAMRMGPRCHPDAHFAITYFSITGCLELQCVACGRTTRLAVATRLPAARN